MRLPIFRLPFNRLILFCSLCAGVACGLWKGDSQLFVKTKKLNRSETLFIGLPSAPDGLDWNINDGTAANIVYENIMEGLVDVDTTTSTIQIIPALARQWQVSDDGLKYTFELKKNIKWSDGKILKPEDFIYSFERILTAKNKSSCAPSLFNIKNAKEFYDGKQKDFSKVGLKELNDKTISIELEEPKGHFPAVFAQTCTFPVRRDLIEKWGSHWTDPDKIVSLGAYQVSSYQKKSVMILKSSASGHLVRNIVFYFGLRSSDALTLYDSQQLDIVADIPKDDLDIFKSKEELISTPLLNITFLTFNVKKKPLNNPIFRRAIGMAVDRSEVIRSGGGTQFPIGEMIPPGLIGYESNRGVRFDSDAAADLLKHSGYRDLEKFHFNLVIEDPAEDRGIAENIRSQLKKNLGIEVKLTSEKRDDYDDPTIYLSQWSSHVPDADIFLSLFKSKAQANKTGWKNHNYDEYVRKAAVTGSVEQREKLYAKAQHILDDEEMPVLPLFADTHYLLVQKRVKEFPVNVLKLMPMKNVSLE